MEHLLNKHNIISKLACLPLPLLLCNLSYPSSQNCPLKTQSDCVILCSKNPTVASHLIQWKPKSPQWSADPPSHPLSPWLLLFLSCSHHVSSTGLRIALQKGQDCPCLWAFALVIVLDCVSAKSRTWNLSKWKNCSCPHLSTGCTAVNKTQTVSPDILLPNP